MGTYASSVINVSIPAANVPALAQALRDWIKSDKYYYRDDHRVTLTDEELVGTLLVDCEGTEEEAEYTFEPDESLDITGSYYGKLAGDVEDVERIYAQHGATGTIDVEAEGDLYRVRLKDGKATYHVGVITYPSDSC